MSFGIHLSQQGHHRAGHEAGSTLLPVSLSRELCSLCGCRHSKVSSWLLPPKLAPTVLQDWLLGPGKSSRRSWDLQRKELSLLRAPSCPQCPGGSPLPMGIHSSAKSCKDGSTSAGRLAPKALQSKEIPALELPRKHWWRFGV